MYVAHVHAGQKSHLDRVGQAGIVSNDVFKDPAAPATLMFWYPDRKSPRFVAQQSFISIGTNVLANHEDLIGAACAVSLKSNPGKVYYQKWIIPKALKPECLRNLRAMNIAAHSLFPGIEGTCRSTAESARLASAIRHA